MSEQTLTGPQLAFEKSMTVLGTLMHIIGWVAFVVGGLALGAAAWLVTIVQANQVPGGGGWLLLMGVFAVLSIIGFIIGVVALGSPSEPRMVPIVNSVISVIMWVLLGICLWVAGTTIEVPARNMLVSAESGTVYEQGEQAPRGYFRQRLIPVVPSFDYTATINRLHDVQGSSQKVNIRKTVTLRVRLEDGPVLERLFLNLRRKGIDNLELHAWTYTDRFMVEFEKEAKRLPPEALAVGKTFRAPRPWMSRIEIISVSESSEIVQPSDTQTASSE